MNPPTLDESITKLSFLNMVVPYNEQCSTENRLLTLMKDLQSLRCIVHEEIQDVDSHLQKHKKFDTVRKSTHDDDETTSALTPDSQEHSGSSPTQQVTHPHWNKLQLESLHSSKYSNAHVFPHRCKKFQMKADRRKQPTFDAKPVASKAQTTARPPHLTSSETSMEVFPATQSSECSTQRRPTFVKIEHQPKSLHPASIMKKRVCAEAEIHFSDQITLQEMDIGFFDFFCDSPHPNLRLRRPTPNDAGCSLVKPPVRKFFLHDERFLQPCKPVRRNDNGENPTKADVKLQPQSAQDVMQSSNVNASLDHPPFVRNAEPVQVSADKECLKESGVDRRIGDISGDFLNKDSTARIQASLMRMAEKMTPKQDHDSQDQECVKRDLPSFAQNDSKISVSLSLCSDQASFDKVANAQSSRQIDRSSSKRARMKFRKAAFSICDRNVSSGYDAYTSLESIDRVLRRQVSRPAPFEINFQKNTVKIPLRRRNLQPSPSRRGLLDLKRYGQSDAPESSHENFIPDVSRQVLADSARVSPRRFKSQQKENKKFAKSKALKSMDWTADFDSIPAVHQAWPPDTKHQPSGLDGFHDDAFYKSWHQDFEILAQNDHANNQEVIASPADNSRFWDGQENACLADLLEGSSDEKQCPSERSYFSFDFQSVDWNDGIPHSGDEGVKTFALTNCNQCLAVMEEVPLHKVFSDDVIRGNKSFTDYAFNCPHILEVFGLVDSTTYSTHYFDHTTTHVGKNSICDANLDIDGLDQSINFPLKPSVQNDFPNLSIVNAGHHEHSLRVDVSTRQPSLSLSKAIRLDKYLEKNKRCCQQEPTPTSFLNFVDNINVMDLDDGESIGIPDIKSNDGTWIDEDFEHFEGSTGSLSRVTFIVATTIGNLSIPQSFPSPASMDIATTLDEAILEGCNLRKFYEAVASDEEIVKVELEKCLRYERNLREIIMLNSSVSALHLVDSSLKRAVYDQSEELQRNVDVLNELKRLAENEEGETCGIKAGQYDQGDNPYQMPALMVEMPMNDDTFDVYSKNCKCVSLLEERDKLLADLYVSVGKMDLLMADFDAHKDMVYTLIDNSGANFNDSLADKSNSLSQKKSLQFEIKDLRGQVKCIEQERSKFWVEIERLSFNIIELAQIKTTQITQIDAMEEVIRQCIL